LQRAFAGAVLDSGAAVPAHITGKSSGKPDRRFGVYRNNVYASLIDVLAGRFPVVERLVGDEFFRAMARAYVEREPPRSAVLIHYGAGFAGFVASFPPAASVPYLGDVASLEWAWHQAYHAADAAALPVAAFTNAAEHAEKAVFELHPSLGVVRSLYPIVSIFELNTRREDMQPVRLEGAEDALVLRPRLEVALRRLPAGGASFIAALGQGATIGEATAVALSATPDFSLETNLAGLIASGAVVGLRTGPTF
jgi:Putative DNA-binding domain